MHDVKLSRYHVGVILVVVVLVFLEKAAAAAWACAS
jgi:hypothetical protein